MYFQNPVSLFSLEKHYYIKLLAIVCIIAVSILIRAIHLDADTPSGLSGSAGLYVDEGYKTLTPRNLVLFGEKKWHPDDTYPGWLPGSALPSGHTLRPLNYLGQTLPAHVW